MIPDPLAPMGVTPSPLPNRENTSPENDNVIRSLVKTKLSNEKSPSKEDFPFIDLNLPNLEENIKSTEAVILILDQEFVELADISKARSIDSKKDDLRDKFLDKIIQLGLNLPFIAQNVYNLAKNFGNLANNPLAYGAIGVAGNVAATISTGFDLYKANKMSKAHQKMTEELKPKQMIESKDLTDNQKIIKDILDKRESIFEKRKNEERDSFSSWFENALAQDFTQFKEAIDIKGLLLPKLEIDRQLQEINESNFEKITNPDIKKDLENKLLEQHIEKKQTLTNYAKNLLKNRLDANEQINKKFFTFKLTKSQVAFGITVITAVAGIALTAAFIAGVAFPPAYLAIPGIIGAAGTLGLIAIGIFHLQENKPNFFKTILEFTEFKILFNQIPIYFAEFSINLLRIKEKFTAFKVNELKDEIHSKNELLSKEELIQDTKFHISEKEANQLKEKIKEWETVKNKYEEKIKVLQDEIKESRKKDFELKTGFKSFTDELSKLNESIKQNEARVNQLLKLHSLTADEQKKLQKLTVKINYAKAQVDKLKEKTADDFEVIAEALIKGEFWKDPESQLFVKKFIGIDISEEFKMNPEKTEAETAYFSEKLRDVFLRKSKEIYDWIENQEKINKN